MIFWNVITARSDLIPGSNSLFPCVCSYKLFFRNIFVRNELRLTFSGELWLVGYSFSCSYLL